MRRIHLRPARSIFSNALNFAPQSPLSSSRHDGIAHSACQEGRRYPLRRRCNRQRPFFVAGDRQSFPLLVTEYRASKVALFDTKTEKFTEYKLPDYTLTVITRKTGRSYAVTCRS